MRRTIESIVRHFNSFPVDLLKRVPAIRIADRLLFALPRRVCSSKISQENTLTHSRAQHTQSTPYHAPPHQQQTPPKQSYMRRSAQPNQLGRPITSLLLQRLEDALHADHALLAVVERGGEALQLLLLPFLETAFVWGDGFVLVSATCPAAIHSNPTTLHHRQISSNQPEQRLTFPTATISVVASSSGVSSFTCTVSSREARCQ